MKKLNLGCGAIRPEGWINTDSSLNAHLQRLPLVGKPLANMMHKVKYDNNNLRYMNLNKRWKFADNSVDIVYSSYDKKAWPPACANRASQIFYL